MKAFQWRHIIVFIVLSIFSLPVFSSADDILGEWVTDGGKSKVNVFRCGNEICGKIVWLKETTYPTDDDEGMAGKIKVDRNNPNKSMRSKPVIGLKLLSGFQYVGGNEWEDGTIYDPTNGKTYDCIITLKNSNTLNVRGYIGFSLLGRTTVWTR